MADGYTVFVNGAAIVLFSSGPRVVGTSDLMNAVLLAQLVANKRAETTTAVDWYDNYLGVLRDYWFRSAGTIQELQMEEGDSASPHEWVAAVLANGIEDEAQAVTASLECVARLPGSLPAMSLLRRHVQKEPASGQAEIPPQTNPVRLLVILAQDKSSMASVYLQFKTRQVVDPNPWGQRFNAEDMDGCISAHFFRGHLSETLYAPAREAIACKVEEASRENIMDITGTINASVILHTKEARS